MDNWKSTLTLLGDSLHRHRNGDLAAIRTAQHHRGVTATSACSNHRTEATRLTPTVNQSATCARNAAAAPSTIAWDVEPTSPHTGHWYYVSTVPSSARFVLEPRCIGIGNAVGIRRKGQSSAVTADPITIQRMRGSSTRRRPPTPSDRK